MGRAEEKMGQDNIDFKTLFPRLTFEAEEEKVFRDYLRTRGIYLYKQVYDALVKWSPDLNKIKYKQFSNQIRYDKGIRDKLYIYLAAAEEHLRNIIFENLEIDDLPENMTKVNLNIELLRFRIETDAQLKSNLYYFSYARNFNFGLIEKIYAKFGLAKLCGLQQSDIKEARKLLRNKVMHHNMLLLSCYTERQDIEKEIANIEVGIEALYRLLPTNELREGVEKSGCICGGLTQAINRSNYPDGDICQEPFDNIICLHKFKSGKFMR